MGKERRRKILGDKKMLGRRSVESKTLNWSVWIGGTWGGEGDGRRE